MSGTVTLRNAEKIRLPLPGQAHATDMEELRSLPDDIEATIFQAFNKRIAEYLKER